MPKTSEKIQVVWLRRDLRVEDQAALHEASLRSELSTLVIFIFDPEILDRLDNPQDRRVQFIWDELNHIDQILQPLSGSVSRFYGKPLEVFQRLQERFAIEHVLCAEDYEPYARKRDAEVKSYLNSTGTQLLSLKDQVIRAPGEVLKSDGTPYTVFTPFKNRWLQALSETDLQEKAVNLQALSFVETGTLKSPLEVSSLGDMKFVDQDLVFPKKTATSATLRDYAAKRNFPSATGGTTQLGVHFRFGTISIRKAVKAARGLSEIWLSELVWREFFMHILFHFPRVVEQSFKPEYDNIEWQDSSEDFQRWAAGETGFPLVDAGMRELNQTGYMHNRVRMVTASFLTKHLLIHWSKGERYFARHLLDFDLSANNGNWQWAASSGCDAAPYFRIFNPTSQIEKFDPKFEYIKKWIPEFGTKSYPLPMVEHTFARNRALETYKRGLGK